MTRELLLTSTMYHHAGQAPFHFEPNPPAAPMRVWLDGGIIARFHPPEVIAACALANAVATSIGLYGFLPPR